MLRVKEALERWAEAAALPWAFLAPWVPLPWLWAVQAEAAMLQAAMLAELPQEEEEQAPRNLPQRTRSPASGVRGGSSGSRTP